MNDKQNVSLNQGFLSSHQKRVYMPAWPIRAWRARLIVQKEMRTYSIGCVNELGLHVLRDKPRGWYISDHIHPDTWKCSVYLHKTLQQQSVHKLFTNSPMTWNNRQEMAIQKAYSLQQKNVEELQHNLLYQPNRVNQHPPQPEFL